MGASSTAPPATFPALGRAPPERSEVAYGNSVGLADEVFAPRSADFARGVISLINVALYVRYDPDSAAAPAFPVLFRVPWTIQVLLSDRCRRRRLAGLCADGKRFRPRDGRACAIHSHRAPDICRRTRCGSLQPKARRAAFPIRRRCCRGVLGLGQFFRLAQCAAFLPPWPCSASPLRLKARRRRRSCRPSRPKG